MCQRRSFQTFPEVEKFSVKIVRAKTGKADVRI